MPWFNNAVMCLLLVSSIALAQDYSIVCNVDTSKQPDVCHLYPAYPCCPDAALANVDAFESLRTLPLMVLDKIGLLGGITTVMSTINYLAPILFANICVAIWHIRRESAMRTARAGAGRVSPFSGAFWLVFGAFILLVFHPLVGVGIKRSLLGGMV